MIERIEKFDYRANHCGELLPAAFTVLKRVDPKTTAHAILAHCTPSYVLVLVPTSTLPVLRSTYPALRTTGRGYLRVPYPLYVGTSM